MSINDGRIILASASPRRKLLLEQIGVRFQVCPVHIDESVAADEQPEDYVTRVASEKAMSGWKQGEGTLPVLAADTAVVLDGMIMGKPKDCSDGLAMLHRLSGKTHQVYTAVSVFMGCEYRALSQTDVSFRPLTQTEILAYWQTGEPLDKAGSYAIQGRGALFVEAIEGSFSGVVGLPLFETGRLLIEAGIPVPVLDNK